MVPFHEVDTLGLTLHMALHVLALVSSPPSLSSLAGCDCMVYNARQEGDEWRRMRTLLNPAFHRTLLKDYTAVCVQQQAHLIP